MNAQNLINNYSNLINSYSKASTTNKIQIKNQLLSIFNEANHVDFNNLNVSIKGYFYLFLGLDVNNKLHAILVHNSTTPDITQIDKYSPIVLEFKSNKFVVNELLKTKLTADNTEITFDEYKKRVKKWENQKESWLLDALDRNIMIQYFIIDQANLKNNMNNYTVFGLFENSTAPKGQSITIDMITANDAYMDRVRPVPPFRP